MTPPRGSKACGVLIATSASKQAAAFPDILTSVEIDVAAIILWQSHAEAAIGELIRLLHPLASETPADGAVVSGSCLAIKVRDLGLPRDSLMGTFVIGFVGL